MTLNTDDVPVIDGFIGCALFLMVILVLDQTLRATVEDLLTLALEV